MFKLGAVVDVLTLAAGSVAVAGLWAWAPVLGVLGTLALVACADGLGRLRAEREVAEEQE